MATVTPNLGLKKPSPAENFNTSDYNNNLDKIDQAIGAPSISVAELQDRVSQILAPGVKTPAVTNGMTYTGITNPDTDNTLYVKSMGILRFCRYNFNGIPSNQVQLNVVLPELASSFYSDASIDYAIGTFSVYATMGSVNGFVNGVVMLQPNVSGKSQIYFLCSQTRSTSNSFSTVYGTSATNFTTGTRQYLAAEFIYQVGG